MRHRCALSCYLTGLFCAMDVTRSRAPRASLFFCISLTVWPVGLSVLTLPSCLWSLRIFPPLPGSRLRIFIATKVQHSLHLRLPMALALFYLLPFCHDFRYFFFLFLLFFNLTYSRWTSSLPSCLWSQRIFPSLPGSRLTIFFIAMQVQRSYNSSTNGSILLTHVPTLSVTKKKHKSNFGKNRTHDFRTSRCAGYLLDHSRATL